MNGVEKSVIDFIIGCEQMEDILENMIIDKQREKVLTKYAASKGHIKQIKSDHNVLFARFKLKYKMKKIEVRREFFI